MSHPLAITPANRAIFHFVASEADCTFECQRDNLNTAACANPLRLPGIVQGEHTLTVKAVDPAGNVSEPASFAWTIAPGTTVSDDIRWERDRR